jgi:hypothetical protein
MRTTLDIEDDVLRAVKDLAENRGTTAGKVLSDLARSALAPRGAAPAVRNGVPLLRRRPAGSAIPTLELVNRLRDET